MAVEDTHGEAGVYPDRSPGSHHKRLPTWSEFNLEGQIEWLIRGLAKYEAIFVCASNDSHNFKTWQATE